MTTSRKGMSQPNSIWVETQGAAKYLGFSRQQFSKLYHDGVFRGARLSERIYRFNIAHLDEDMMIHEECYY
ncbi:hypothetical protein [Weissella cibaria]|uniref:hypothetical protein n=1 Tax=Weissella cibaria TaxID=137591 RepID=UPI003D3694B1